MSSSRESSGREPIRGFNIDLPTFEPSSKKNCWKSRIPLRKIADDSIALNNPNSTPIGRVIYFHSLNLVDVIHLYQNTCVCYSSGVSSHSGQKKGKQMKIQRIATHVFRLMFFTALSAVIQVQADSGASTAGETGYDPGKDRRSRKASA